MPPTPASPATHPLPAATPVRRSGLATCALLAFALLVAASGTGCAWWTTPHDVDSKFVVADAPSGPTAVVVPPVVDARSFTDSANRAPVPSVQGDPADTALTSRTIGRDVASFQTLGSNIVLPEDESVAEWVRRAVIDGLRQVDLAAAPAPVEATGETPRLDVTVNSFWLDAKRIAPVAIVEYRARIDIIGDLDRFGEGRTIEARGTVSAGGLDTVLWRRAFDRALEEIAEETAEAATGRDL